MNPQEILHSRTVLVLNRNWQAIHSRSVADAISQIMAGAATPIDISVDGDSMTPIKDWAEWMKLPVREHDQAIRTVRGPVRVPTVICCVNYSKVPKRRPKFGGKAIRARDANRCQYTGRLLTPGEGNIDHILPVSRGGADSFENCVLAAKEINSRKGARTPKEAGLRLLRVPSAPRELPVTMFIQNPGVRDWDHFLKLN